MLGLSESGIYKSMSKLRTDGKIKRVEGKNGGHWEIIEQSFATQPTAGKIADQEKWQPSAAEIQSPWRHNCNLQLAPSRLDFSQDVFEILNQTGRGEIERVTFR